MSQAETKVKYVASKGSSYSNKDARIVGPELSRIASEYENPTNETVVELAADPASPLHPYIHDLSDREAARRHRLHVAADLVGSILVEYRVGEETRTTRAFEYITIVEAPEPDQAPAQEPGVRPRFARQPRRIVTLEYVISHRDAADEVIENALLTLRAFEQKYRGYCDTIPGFRQKFRGVWREIQKLFAERPPPPRRRRR
jgi:hypothetical protein